MMEASYTYEHYYFKWFNHETRGMSGWILPGDTDKPYTFIRCEFHPRLWEYLSNTPEVSKNWTFIDCNYPR